jgi:general secretion pathway protein C
MKHRWFYNLLVIGLVTYFGVSAGLSLWRARLEVELESSTTEVKAAIKKPAEVPPLDNYNIIAERNLFGSSEEEGSAASEEVSLEGIPLAKQSQGLKLVGTVVAEESQENLAFIETRSSRKQEAYREGDRVDEVLVKKILRNNVIINSGEQDEVLTMEPEEDSQPSPPPRQPVRRPQPRPAPQAGGTIRLERDDVESSLTDLNQMMKEVRVRPYLEGQEPAGFVVSNIKPGSIFARMGLRNGDIIKGVNQEAITSPDQAVDLYESLVDGGEVAIEIRRGRRNQQLRYEIE